MHRAAHTLAARSTDAFEAAREKVRRFLNAPSDDEHRLGARHHRGDQPRSQGWGGRNVGEGDEVVVTNLEHHSNIVPWQMLCAEKGATLRVAPVDDRGDILLDEYEKLLNPKTRIVAFTQVSNALGTVTPVARDGRDRASPRRARARRRRPGRLAHAGRRAGARTPISTCSPATRCSARPASARSTASPSELEAMPPWQGGGNMIQDVTFEKSVVPGPAGEVRGRHRHHRRRGRAWRGDRLPRADRHGQYRGLRARAARIRDLGSPHRARGCASSARREKAGVASFVLDECRSRTSARRSTRRASPCAPAIIAPSRSCAASASRPPCVPRCALYNTTDDVDALVAALQRIPAERGKRGY